MDEYPEAAFLFAGTIEDVIEKAKTMEHNAERGVTYGKRI